ncbi:MAG: single-stranded-DNA-specific exonuclease RecJ [Lachnospiraceae bacterium]|nr:single-stranded-DNA-specific exonuclease RecJ [Lachnospiraceae bacterium]
MRERWILQSKKGDFAGIGRRFGIDPVTARVMRNRNVATDEEIDSYLNGGIPQLHDAHQMKDADKAAGMIETAIRNGIEIGIASDFDNDGIFSGMVLYEGIRFLGGKASIYTPHRVLEGYGLNDRIVHEAYDAGCRMILTCDNGIAAFEAVELAKSLGMQVIVTDHHEIPYVETDGVRSFRLPCADAIVNPKQEDCGYPYKNLCGTGVAYKVIALLYERFGRRTEEVYRFLDYTAIATVADVMELNGENRILVKEGLKLLRTTKRVGLKALMDVTGIEPSSISSYHIGFVLGPCFNAAGRLDTVKLALQLLQEQEEEKALELAGKLRSMNEERKTMTQTGTQKAIEVIEQASWKEDRVYLVYLPDCHESVAGIIAGRLRERFWRPVLVFTDAMEEGYLKASGRSIDAYDMFEQLNKNRELYARFGGHKMAAGLTMKAEYLDVLRKRLRSQCPLTAEDLRPVVLIDTPLPLEYISEPLIQDLEKLEPFGRGNEKPLFAWQHVTILRLTRIGKNRDMLKLQVCGSGGRAMDALYFGDADGFLAFLEEEYGAEAVARAFKGMGGTMDAAFTFYPQVNMFRDQRSLQIVVQNYCRIAKK